MKLKDLVEMLKKQKLDALRNEQSYEFEFIVINSRSEYRITCSINKSIEITVSSHRQEVRTFKSLEAAKNAIFAEGIKAFTVVG